MSITATFNHSGLPYGLPVNLLGASSYRSTFRALKRSNHHSLIYGRIRGLCRSYDRLSRPQSLGCRNEITGRSPSTSSFKWKEVHSGIGPSLCQQSASTSALTEPPPKRLEEPSAYSPPQTGLLSFLPASVVPYAELIRLDKPTGTYYLFFPCLFSTLLAAPLATPIASPLAVIGTGALFFTGALVMRGAGCSINDLWDRNLDPHVARTRLRPIARGAISPQKAIVYTGVQLLTGLAVLLQFPYQCLYYGIPSLALVATYPLAKRVTYYPQFVLGLTFSWGAIMGFPALGVNLISDPSALTAAGLLYASCVSWTVLYDMIYAHMDIKDDVKAGIKSIALAHEKNTKAVLSGLAVTQIGFLAAAGMAAGAGPVFFAGSCGSAAITLGMMINKVDLKDPKDCWWWFKNGAWFTGGSIAAGLFGDYLARMLGLYDDEGVVADLESKRN